MGKKECEGIIIKKKAFLHVLSVRCGNKYLYFNTPCLYFPYLMRSKHLGFLQCEQINLVKNRLGQFKVYLFEVTTNGCRFKGESDKFTLTMLLLCSRAAALHRKTNKQTNYG